ncbi:MAG: late competence development ComFB family protein [Treponema sp.]|jgi:competence protein ComFB|nr:late competence development ComFB family protein [Treponema sp.]
MALTDKYDFEFLVNEAEKLVFDELEKQFKTYEGELCLCNDCVADMAAFALNAMKPMYHYSLIGSLYANHALSDEELALQVQEVVSNAIERVRENPSHG